MSCAARCSVTLRMLHQRMSRGDHTRARNKRRRALHDLKSGPCVDCGVVYPTYVLDFDHRDPQTKCFSIASAMAHGYAWAAVVSEVAKCDLVCANCHRQRTHAGKHSTPPVFEERTKTHCRHGHELNEKNTKWRRRRGEYVHRECQVCVSRTDEHRLARKRAATEARRREAPERTHCKNGHLLSGANLRVRKPAQPWHTPAKLCRICEAASLAEWKARTKYERCRALPVVPPQP